MTEKKEKEKRKYITIWTRKTKKMNGLFRLSEASHLSLRLQQLTRKSALITQ